MSKFTHTIAGYMVRNRWLVILIMISTSAVAAVGYVNPKLLTELWEAESPTPSDEDDAAPTGRASRRTQSDNVSPISFSNSDAILVVQCEDFFNPEAVEAMRKVARELERLDQVSNVLWLDRVPILNIFGLSQPLLPQAKASPSRFEVAKQKAQEHPLVGGQLLSDDCKTQLMLIGYNYLHVMNNYDATTLLKDTAHKALEEFPDTQMTFSVTGRMPSAIAALEAHQSNLLKFQIIGYSMIFLMALVLFRGLRAVIIVALAPILGVVWTLGFIRYFDYGNNPLIDVILPILVSLVGLTDGVHLMVQIRKLRAEGLSPRESSIQGLQQVGLACFLTSLTTAIGFSSLTLADSSWVQEFGTCCTVGVTLCFLSVVTVIPLACQSPLGRNVHVGIEKSLIDRNLGRIGTVIVWVLDRRVLMATCAIVSTVVLGGLSLTLKPDQRRSDNLPQDSEAIQALYQVDEAFGGLEFSRVEIEWEESVPSDSPEVLEVVTAVDDLLKQEALIGHPLSLRNLIDAQPGSGPPAERMTLLDLLPPPLKLAFYKPDKGQATVTFRVKDLGIAAYGEVFTRIEEALEQIKNEHPGFRLELLGDAVWRWRNLYQIVIDLATSLGTATIIILIVLTLVFRSIRLGIVSIIPNLFPLAFTGACLALANYNLELVMVCNFTICLGIAVDDTIHFLTRFLEESEHEANTDLAIKKAFTGVGTALIMTTAVLVAGFSIVTFSDAREHFIFAVMGALTIAAALFCDLVFLPALLAVFLKRKQVDDPH